jgi:hypothetical protein
MMRRTGARALACFSMVIALSPAIDAATASFSGRLAAVPCRNDGDIAISDGEVRSDERVTCAAQAGGEVRLENTSVQPGGRLHVRVGGTAAAWGETACDPNVDGDCNHCANDVQTQFLALFSDYDEDLLSWSFDANDYYVPAGKQPNDSIVDVDVKTHVQGFVRTNSALRPYAGTHSWKDETSDPGSLFVVDDDLELTQLHDTWNNHPTGAAILGSRMWYGDKPVDNSPYVLRSLIVDSIFDTTLTILPLPADFQGSGPTMGGGVGIAKLASGGYLLVATGPGGNDSPPHTDFFFMIGNEDVTGARSALGAEKANGEYDLEIMGLARWLNSDADNGFISSQSQFQWSENISVITECGSGDIYVINSSGEDGGIDLYGSGYYRLSRVDWGTLTDANRTTGSAPGATGPMLFPVAMGWQDTNEHECWQRASATAYVNANHEIELYCVERKATPLETNMHFVRRRPN